MKLKPIIPILAGLLLLVSCKDNDDAALSYKGNVDSNYMEALAQGRESACFNLVNDRKLTLNSAGEYEECSDNNVGYESCLPDNIRIIDGRCWVYLNIPPNTITELLLAESWWIYCTEIGFSKDIYVAGKVEYNAESRQLTILSPDLICDITATVEKAEGASLNLSYVSRIYDSNMNLKSENLYIACYVKSLLVIPDADKTLVYDSAEEAELAMIAMMREYFGDTLNFSDYASRYTGAISFDKLEAAISNHTVYTFDE